MDRPQLNYGMLAGRLAAALLLVLAWLQPDPSESHQLTRIADDPADATGIAASLEAAFREMPLGAPAAVVIESDGYWPRSIEPLLSMADAAGTAVLWQPAVNDDARIASVSVPGAVQPGQPIAVAVTSIVPDGAGVDIVVHANGVRSEPRAAISRVPIAVILDSEFNDDIVIDAELVDRATGEVVARTQGAAIVNVVAEPRVLLVTDDVSPIGVSLQRGGWPVTTISPRQLAAVDEPLGNFSLILLDDVAATAVNDAAWSRVALAVREQAVGLLVLGGPHSFAAGAYRESTLETLLPVISEPPESVKPAAVVFVVDVSGSMDRGDRIAFDAARLAVLETADGLRPSDRAGLVVFDVEAQTLLPVDARDDHRVALQRVWPRSAGGGTSLLPALDLALTELSTDNAEQKMLVLVTDGRLSEGDSLALARRFGDGAIEAIALLVGDATTAGALAETGNLDVIPIDNVLRLPNLMRAAVDARRAPVVQERTIPIPVDASAFPGFRWPTLDAYALTRPRNDADVLLASEAGDPLYARWNVGAGRVAVLTGGLGVWAADWLTWDQWPDFVGGLARGLAVGQKKRIGIDPVRSSEFVITVDEFSGTAARKATLVSPDGTADAVSLLPVAPGQYGGTVLLPLPGLYTFSWDTAGGRQRHRFSRSQVIDSTLTTRRSADDYVDAGLVLRWSETLEHELASGQRVKTWLVILAFMVLLVTIAAERLPVSTWLSRFTKSQRQPGITG